MSYNAQNARARVKQWQKDNRNLYKKQRNDTAQNMLSSSSDDRLQQMALTYPGKYVSASKLNNVSKFCRDGGKQKVGALVQFISGKADSSSDDRLQQMALTYPGKYVSASKLNNVSKFCRDGGKQKVGALVQFISGKAEQESTATEPPSSLSLSKKAGKTQSACQDSTEEQTRSIAYEKLVEALSQNSLLKGIKQAFPCSTDQLLRGIPLYCKSVCPKDAGLLLLGDVVLHYFSSPSLQLQSKKADKDCVAELYETMTTTPREVLNGIREELAEEEPEALHNMLVEKEDKGTATSKYKQRKAKETVLCPSTCSGIFTLP
ncbi:hypothetical protein ACROYT_G014545 [Oculina patagonica]